MKILLNPENNKDLVSIYERAFLKGSEIYLATAFLTDWSFKVSLNRKCKKFVAIVGTNFGLTRKKACQKLFDWLPRNIAYSAMAYRVKPGVTFHPKILVWKEDESYFALVGSSNLTSAAMNTNFEVNSFSEIDVRQFNSITSWFLNRFYESEKIEPSWIEKYVEADLKNCRSIKITEEKESVFNLKINAPKNAAEGLARRRLQCCNFLAQKSRILQLLNECVAWKNKGDVSDDEIKQYEKKFWSNFSKLWFFSKDDKPEQFRFQGSGVERKCTDSRWSESTEALLEVINSANNLSVDDLDILVAKKIDELAEKKNPARHAWFSEMLCQFFPNFYPVINDPVQSWIDSLDWRFASGLTEGQWYIEFSRRMRAVVYQNRDLVDNIAELDHIIWIIQDNNSRDEK